MSPTASDHPEERYHLEVDTRHPEEWVLVDLRGSFWVIDLDHRTWVRASVDQLARLREALGLPK